LGQCEVGRSGDWLRDVAAGSDMGARVAGFDWAATSLGPVDIWSSELRAAVRMCLSTRFPMLVLSGPERLMIYNDGYRQMLGKDKHPGALGAPAAEIWSEIWDVVGPMIDEVLETGRPTWSQDQRLVIERNGYPEECYFTYSFSPTRDDDGKVTGLVTIASETTASISSRRRLSCLTDLTSTLVGAEDITDVCLKATEVMSRWSPPVRAADIYLRVEDRFILIASNRRNVRPVLDVDVADGRTVQDVLRAEERRTVPVPEIAVPLGGTDGGAVGVMALALNENRPFDNGYRQFVEVAAQSVGAALDRALRHAMELDEYRRIGDTLQEAMLQPASNFKTVIARYLPATGNLAVGGDWYDVIKLPGNRRALVVGDCVGHGLEAAAAMSQLRSAARAMLLQGSDPAETLNGIDLFSRSVPGAQYATATCMIVEPAARRLTYARAGHPYPLVVGSSGVTWLDEGAGPPLGFLRDPVHTNSVHHLEGDEIIILYSDGLVERRGETIDVGLERLAEEAGRLRNLPVEEIADGLIGALLPETPDDDVVLVVKQVAHAVGPATPMPETSGA
jgi:hypothetical protein